MQRILESERLDKIGHVSNEMVALTLMRLHDLAVESSPFPRIAFLAGKGSTRYSLFMTKGFSAMPCDKEAY